MKASNPALAKIMPLKAKNKFAAYLAALPGFASRGKSRNLEKTSIIIISFAIKAAQPSTLSLPGPGADPIFNYSGILSGVSAYMADAFNNKECADYF